MVLAGCSEAHHLVASKAGEFCKERWGPNPLAILWDQVAAFISKEGSQISYNCPHGGFYH